MLNDYVREKLVELDHERAAQQARLPQPDPATTRDHRLLAPIVNAAGKRVRRVGEALEFWATPARTPSRAPDRRDQNSFWV